MDTARFAVIGTVSENGTGVGNMQMALSDAEGGAAGMTWTRADGSYVLANLAGGTYSLGAEKTGYAVIGTPQSVTIAGANQTVDFTAASVPSLEFVFDFTEVHVGSTMQVTWSYRNIADDAQVWLLKKINSDVTELATVPISDGYYLWEVNDPVTNTAALQIILVSDDTVRDLDSFRIVPKLPDSAVKFPWPMFLPAINGGKP